MGKWADEDPACPVCGSWSCPNAGYKSSYSGCPSESVEDSDGHSCSSSADLSASTVIHENSSALQANKPRGGAKLLAWVISILIIAAVFALLAKIVGL